MISHIDKEHPDAAGFMERVLMQYSSEDGSYQVELVELTDGSRTMGFEVNSTDKGGTRGLDSVTAGFNNFIEAREYYLACEKLAPLTECPAKKASE